MRRTSERSVGSRRGTNWIRHSPMWNRLTITSTVFVICSGLCLTRKSSSSITNNELPIQNSIKMTNTKAIIAQWAPLKGLSYDASFKL